LLCHGLGPVSSTSSEKLKKVRIKTMMPSTATLLRVGSVATVWMMSPATSSSRPSKMVWPSCWRKRLLAVVGGRASRRRDDLGAQPDDNQIGGHLPGDYQGIQQWEPMVPAVAGRSTLGGR
jgi:hypothetical protein